MSSKTKFPPLDAIDSDTADPSKPLLPVITVTLSFISNWITLLEDNQVKILVELTGDYDIDLKNVAEFENKIIEKCKSDKPEILESILNSGKLEEDKEKLLVELINQLKASFKS